MENSFSHLKRKDVDVSQGPPQKRKRNACSSSRQDTHVVRPLDFMIELVLHNSFSLVF
jgi:hypothetical protein